MQRVAGKNWHGPRGYGPLFQGFLFFLFFMEMENASELAPAANVHRQALTPQMTHITGAILEIFFRARTKVLQVAILKIASWTRRLLNL